ncbi:MAG: hypothetical protein KC668_14610 [Myxococcales bacterium]|nr:hypothetical protein [Myxococcales bacterium]
MGLASSMQNLREGEIKSLACSSGLSLEATRWAIRSTFADMTAQHLISWLNEAELPGHRARPIGLLGVVLSGNVLTSPARTLLLPLLMGVPVLARVSSREQLFASLLERTLLDGCPAMRSLARGIGLVSFDYDGPAGAETLRAFLGAVDTVSVYGGDETCGAVARLAPLGVPVLQHGHGLGVGVLPSSANAGREAVAEAAAAYALDVAAYDQRGCLSPQAIYVEDNGWVSPEGFAEELLEALDVLERTLPRGPLPTSIAAEQAQFRGVASVVGRALEGNASCVTYEADRPPRSSPGYRNIAVHRYADEPALLRNLGVLGPRLKVIGLAGTASTRSRLMGVLPAGLTPRVCAPGEMQTPPFTCVWDGLPAWHGLVRYVAS